MFWGISTLKCGWQIGHHLTAVKEEGTVITEMVDEKTSVHSELVTETCYILLLGVLGSLQLNTHLH